MGIWFVCVLTDAKRVGKLGCPGRCFLSNFGRTFCGINPSKQSQKIQFFMFLGSFGDMLEWGCPLYRGLINPTKCECRKVCP